MLAYKKIRSLARRSPFPVHEGKGNGAAMIVSFCKKLSRENSSLFYEDPGSLDSAWIIVEDGAGGFLRMDTFGDLLRALRGAPRARSAWSRGVRYYAGDIVLAALDGRPAADVALPDVNDLSTALLRGAEDWRAYSAGGCALVADAAIAACLCSPSEIRRVTRADGSLRAPNAREDWLDAQAHALFQAGELLKGLYK